MIGASPLLTSPHSTSHYPEWIRMQIHKTLWAERRYRKSFPLTYARRAGQAVPSKESCPPFLLRFTTSHTTPDCKLCSTGPQIWRPTGSSSSHCQRGHCHQPPVALVPFMKMYLMHQQASATMMHQQTAMMTHLQAAMMLHLWNRLVHVLNQAGVILIHMWYTCAS